MGSKLLLPDAVLRSVFMPQNHFREPKNRREHLLSSLPIVLPVAAVTISAAAFGLLFLQGNPVESVEESLTYTAAIGAADEQVEMYVYDAGNDEVEEAEEEASEMNAASSYAAKERILPAGEVEDTAELVDAYSSLCHYLFQAAILRSKACRHGLSCLKIIFQTACTGTISVWTQAK